MNGDQWLDEQEAREYGVKAGIKQGLKQGFQVGYITGYEKGKLLQKAVLDKIRAEIEQAANKQFQIAMDVTDLNERYMHIQMENAYRHSLNIIDKYKAESEEEG